ncbi:hypothetical protein Daus18300_003461 [Diaporthe australafricana]|uniref:Nudix hydrolase domain-containing protein n=1 Tax=Diaporthe australafricana TaxID=127596 RepID=A0ABR3XER7_9PEZI
MSSNRVIQESPMNHLGPAISTDTPAKTADAQDWNVYVRCNTCGQSHFGAGGAAGLLLVRRDYSLPGHPATHIVMQHRDDFTSGGRQDLTSPDEEPWGIPGGALEYGETPRQAAIREASEEVSLPFDCARGDSPLIAAREKIVLARHEAWKYTTFIADVLRDFEPRMPPDDFESFSVEWVPIDQVGVGRFSPLLPAFLDAWPTLRAMIQRVDRPGASREVYLKRRLTSTLFGLEPVQSRHE